MGGPNWTKEQREVIDHRNGNLLVSAAAGSGKTAVLVERIINMITDSNSKVDIDSLLVVTFTNAAASEMRERIGEAISKALEKDPSNEHLQKQMLLLNRASITTIHSFCLDVIRSNIHLTDVDPNFRIGDSTECVLIEQEALDEVFEERYCENMLRGAGKDGKRGTFLELIECFAERNGDSSVQNMILSIYHFATAFPEPEKWLDKSAEAFNVDDEFKFSESEWSEASAKYIKIEIEDAKVKMDSAYNILQPYKMDIPKAEKIMNEKIQIGEICEACNKSWSDIEKAMSSFITEDYRKGKRIPKDAEIEVTEAWNEAKEIRDGAIKRISKIADEFSKRDDSSIKDEMKKIYPVMREVSDVVKAFSDKFHEKKNEKGIIDFSDIEHLAFEILTDKDKDGNIVPSEVAREYRDEFTEIFVDEYQDSNTIQETILDSIANKENLNRFMVGDVKQSIYRFRQANPEIFLEKYRRYSTDSDADEKKIMLYKNFRSRSTVLEAVNYIFEQIMSINIGEIEYNEDEKLNPGASFPEPEDNTTICGGPCEIYLVDKSISNELSEEEDIDNIQLEARAVGNIINNLIIGNENGEKYKVYDRKAEKYRDAKYKDIVILMRATSQWSGIFTDELINMGIPAYADAGNGYFDTIEIKTVISLLKIIDNPMQDIPLLSVLKSPMFSFTSEELIDIRIADRKSDFYTAMKKFSENEDTGSEKVDSFLNKLDEYRKKSYYMSTDELLWYLYNDTGYYSYLGLLPAGTQRQANLKILFERAKQFENTSFRGIFNFINFIEKLKKSNTDMGEAKTIAENADVVRIMSIHKSKGLEFPIVICSGTGKKFNKMDMNRNVLYHQDLGFGPQVVDTETRLSYPSAVKEAIKKRMMLDTLSEEMRILYVAFTRAKEKLIITGSVKDIDSNMKKWSGISEKISDSSTMSAGSFIDWIMPSVIKYRREKDENNRNWEIKIREKSYFISEEEIEDDRNLSEVFRESISSKGPGKYYDDIKNRLDFVYPYKRSTERAGTVSVTEIKTLSNKINEEETAEDEQLVKKEQRHVKRPKFIQEKYEEEKLTGARRGTAVHLVMQIIDIEKTNTVEEIKKQIEEFKNKEILTDKEAEAVNPYMVFKFFKSDLGKRMKEADFIGREKAFCRNIDIEDLYIHEKIGYNEDIMLRGVIDLYFEEDGEIVLVDYKTDFVNDENRDKVVDRYRKQLDIYSETLERVTGKTVKEKYLYLFGVSEAVKL